MKKYLLLTTVFFILFLIYTTNVFGYTDSIDNITMDINIDSNGNANIVEKWIAEIGTGTELYKTFNNLETSEITKIVVSDETDTTYTFLSDWDINASQSKKANKCGINTIGNGIELCWGIGEYGKHTYFLSYTITNFIQQYTDCQAIYFTLIPQAIDPNPSEVTITISSSFDFNEASTSVNGYGYTGTASIENGKLIFKTSSKMSDTQYMTVHASFPSYTFNTTDIIDESFETKMQYNNSYNKSTYNGNTYKDDTTFSSSSILFFIIIIFIFLSMFSIRGYGRRYGGYDGHWGYGGFWWPRRHHHHHHHRPRPPFGGGHWGSSGGGGFGRKSQRWLIKWWRL